MCRLVWALAGRRYHIVGNRMSRLIYKTINNKVWEKKILENINEEHLIDQAHPMLYNYLSWFWGWDRKKTIPGIAVWYHKACWVITSGDLEDGSFYPIIKQIIYIILLAHHWPFIFLKKLSEVLWTRQDALLYDWRESCLLIGPICLHKSLCLPENWSKLAQKVI